MGANGNAATQAVLGLLMHPTGLPATIAALSEQQGITLAPLPAGQVWAQQITQEAAERGGASSYPAVFVYCEGMVNELREKFRSFSGKAQMAIEMRVSQDRFDSLPQDLHRYTEAITEVLGRSRGTLAPGMFFGGGYKVEFGPVKRGGKNFLQSAKITFDLQVSLP
jgi:hypothetical protein